MSNQKLPVVSIPGSGSCAPLASEPLPAPEAARLAPLFKAIGDPVRLRLLSMIASHPGGETCVCELTGAFDLTPPTISHHLKVLREAGLIGSQRRGTWVYYWIDPAMMARMSALLAPEPTAALHDHPNGQGNHCIADRDRTGPPDPHG
jgi:ArsR family transcriptional regulator, arsenate/arsenite/antimonite-responsive transcriptional repressor